MLGDMLELGPAENQYHLEAGALLPAYGWDYLVTVGFRARLIAEGAVRHGLDSSRKNLLTDQKRQRIGLNHL